MQNEVKQPASYRIVQALEHLKWAFFWLDWFYPNAKSVSVAHKLYCFLPQKIFRVNGSATWPMHFTSRVLHPKNVKVGNRSAPGLNSGAYIQAKNGIVIGNNCRFGPNVGLISANHSSDDYDAWDTNSPIQIGNNVWIGMNSVVMPAVRIGDNVIIGANSTVTRDIPSNSIAVGSPCKVVKVKPPYKGREYVS